MKKRIIPVTMTMLMSLVMALAIIPLMTAPAYADSVMEIDGVKYTLHDEDGNKTATVSGKTTDLPEGVKIPATVSSDGVDYAVTSIGAYAFDSCMSLTSFTVPASVKSIGESAFSYCSTLGTVTFAEGSKLESIGNNAFRGTGITSIEIPASVTSIGARAFQSCSNLGEVAIEEGSKLESIGLSAFQSCSNLREVEIAEGINLKRIEKDAFNQCTNLTSFTVPASVTSIGEGAFYNCNNLETVVIEGESNLENIEEKAFLDCSLLNNVYYAGTEEQWNNMSGRDSNWAGGREDAITVHFVTGVARVPKGKTLIYNGSMQIGVDAGTGYTLTDNSATDAGSYEATATLDPGYVWADGTEDPKTIDWKIDKDSIEVPEGKNLTYNGEEQTGVPAGEGYTLSGETAKDEGAYQAKATPDKNHIWADGTEESKTINWTISHEHKWGAPTYEWSADNKTVTATRVCVWNADHTETETVKASAEVTEEPTCTAKGKTTYTSAEFNNKAFAAQTKTVEDVEALGHDWKAATCTEPKTCERCKLTEGEALGHDWGEPKYEWSADNKTVTATRVCGTITDHVEAETVNVTSEVTKPATCTAKGETTYTATFTNEAFAAQTKTLEDVEALGHKWDDGVVTKEATAEAEGVKTYTCTVCKETKAEAIPKLAPTPGTDDKPSDGGEEIKPAPTPEPGSDPDQKGMDGTAVGEGASAASAEIAITSMNSDTDPKGALFSVLRLKSTKQTSNSITLTWAGNSKVAEYVIYGSKSGRNNKPKELARVKGRNTETIREVAGNKLKKGTYYKFIIVGLDGNKNVVSTSKLIHAATKGGKAGNYKSVTVKKSVLKKAKKLKKGKTLKLNARAVAQSKKLKVKKLAAMRYESTNSSVATVSKKGAVKGKSKGTCYVYAYAQNGAFRRIKVTVK